ncbi:Oidioi.mRNA.OKI2018_I69.XSR.g13795.t1.cds [Oikopleura dioica]|uniref:Oidioi.mRNA.OKI2018_I69.XSR.g13795.t1.cds n=1 Tax=Oikopleura dioica TaxID=34765 RepID=A0ABN7SE34_OIKDI|nr:Oidioi.mRNA.OKI2018_I69.XSR.g13795.t1.cds [Oikopleura dioica]
MADSGSNPEEGSIPNESVQSVGQSFIEPTGEEINDTAVIDSFEDTGKPSVPVDGNQAAGQGAAPLPGVSGAANATNTDFFNQENSLIKDPKKTRLISPTIRQPRGTKKIKPKVYIPVMIGIPTPVLVRPEFDPALDFNFYDPSLSPPLPSPFFDYGYSSGIASPWSSSGFSSSTSPCISPFFSPKPWHAPFQDSLNSQNPSPKNAFTPKQSSDAGLLAPTPQIAEKPTQTLNPKPIPIAKTRPPPIIKPKLIQHSQPRTALIVKPKKVSNPKLIPKATQKPPPAAKRSYSASVRGVQKPRLSPVKAQKKLTYSDSVKRSLTANPEQTQNNSYSAGKHSNPRKDIKKSSKGQVYKPPHLKKREAAEKAAQESAKEAAERAAKEPTHVAAEEVRKEDPIGPENSPKKKEFLALCKPFRQPEEPILYRREPLLKPPMPAQAPRQMGFGLDMSTLLQNQATLSLLQQQQQLLTGQAPNTAQTNQANLLLAAQLAQLQSLMPWAPAMAQTAPPADLYAQLGATAQLLNPFMGFPADGMYNPLAMNPMTGWPGAPQSQNHRPSQKTASQNAKSSKSAGNRSQQTPSTSGKSPFGMSALETQLIDIINGQAQQGEGSQNGEDTDRYSRKVFVGGLPPDIDEDEIQASFRKYGPLVVDWPHKNESRSYFPPKGYAFLLFQDEVSVHGLVQVCVKEDDKLFTTISSPTIKDKAVQIRPWNLSDSDYVMDGSAPLDPRKTIFVGGVPRPLRAVELAIIMERLYGSVCYAGIDTDPELKYPKGAGRVAFSSQQSYIAAISARFVQLQYGDIDKRVEVKPYVLDDQMCDECAGQRCGGKFAPFFCANVNCLQYYCENCWASIHARPERAFHKPLVKESTYTRSNRTSGQQQQASAQSAAAATQSQQASQFLLS